MIRKAKISDVGTIMTIINETVKEMKSYGNNQWDENYPNSETFINDIKMIAYMCMKKTTI